VRVLGRRPVTDPAELATVVAECLPHLDPGLRLLGRAANAGEVTVYLACVDGARRLVLILCDIVAGPDAVLRAVEGAAWWGEHPELLAHLAEDALRLELHLDRQRGLDAVHGRQSRRLFFQPPIPITGGLGDSLLPGSHCIDGRSVELHDPGVGEQAAGSLLLQCVEVLLRDDVHLHGRPQGIGRLKAVA